MENPPLEQTPQPISILFPPTQDTQVAEKITQTNHLISQINEEVSSLKLHVSPYKQASLLQSPGFSKAHVFTSELPFKELNQLTEKKYVKDEEINALKGALK